MISIEVDRNGKAVRYSIKRGTGHEVLDKALLEAVGRIKRFPKLPRSYGKPTLRFLVFFRFSLVEG